MKLNPAPFSLLAAVSGLLLSTAITASTASTALPQRALVQDSDTGIYLPKGFDAEVVYSIPKSQGSWVAMAFDPKGRLIVSDQDDNCLL